MNRPSLAPLILGIFIILAACRNGDPSPANSGATPIASASPGSGYDPSLTDLNRVKPGTPAPDFDLADVNGRRVRLSDYRGQKYVVLVFYRGYFCPSCVDQLGKLKMLLAPEERRHVQIIAISNDTSAESQVMMTEIDDMPGTLDFPLLEDKGYRVIGRYGIFNPAEFKPGIPYPTVYLINKDGLVIERFLDLERGARATNFQIREVLRGAGALK
jgi:peroxiredoxin